MRNFKFWVIVTSILLLAPLAAQAATTILCKDSEKTSYLRYVYVQSGSFTSSKDSEAILISGACKYLDSGDVYSYGLREIELYEGFDRYDIYKARFTADNKIYYYFIID